MYRARVGDVIEFEGYIGVIHATSGDGHPEYTCLDWLTRPHPEYDYRKSHPELGDWCVPEEYERKFKLICNVREKS